MTNSDKKNTFVINDTIKKEFESIRANSQFTKLTNRVKTNLRNGEVKIHYIHNPYLAKIFDIAEGVEHDKGFEISVQPTDQKTTPDQQHKTSALKSLWNYFLTGIEKGEDYFKNEFETTYKQLYLNNPERLFDTLNTDYTEGIFGYKHANESQKMTIAKYKKNEPIVFNEFSIFNYGFLNGVCDSFLNFITSKPTLQKQVNETSISVRANSNPSTLKAVYKKLAEVWFFGFKQGSENKILNLDNWETYKNEFYSFKISSYEDKYTLDEKKELERLNIAKIKAKDYDFDILKNRYLNYLNEVEDNPKTKVKKPTKIEDFFIDTTAEQNKQLSKLISPLKGKELAMFISLAFNDFKILNLKQNSKDGFNQKSFIEMQNKVNQSVNKYLDAYFGFTGDNKDLESLKKQLNTILKDS